MQHYLRNCKIFKKPFPFYKVFTKHFGLDGHHQVSTVEVGGLIYALVYPTEMGRCPCVLHGMNT
jgi:hypothetical protein